MNILPSYYFMPMIRSKSKLTGIIQNQKKQAIIDTVISHYHMDMADLAGKSREAPLVFVRQLLMYLLKTYTSLSCREIGELFHRDHTAVVYASRMMENYLFSGYRKDEIREFLTRCA